MTLVTFANLWIDGHWHTDVTVSIDADGFVESLSAETGSSESTLHYVPGLTVPGLTSAHCHAFQRALQGWTQRARSATENFWTWREAMYAVATHLTREDLEAITARCYVDLLRSGYTGAVEFLYLHRLGKSPQAVLDADAAIVAAAGRTGIALTLLPALYQHADFGGKQPTAAQLHFVRSSAQFVRDWEELKQRYAVQANIRLGIAFHSLRAVDIDTIDEIHHELRNDAKCVAFHIHVAEQPAEVDACVAHHGLRPVELLSDRGVLNEHWSLIHATHTTREELDLIIRSKATVVVCPTTEADLGDGCIDAGYLIDNGGSMAIGSDSNVNVHALSELRQLEWSQRLARGQRNVLASAKEPLVADRLYRAALIGGQQAVGRFNHQRLRGDFVTYANDASDWEEHPKENYLSTLVFGSCVPQANDVMIGGRWLIRNGKHKFQDEIDERYRATLRRLRPILGAALSKVST